MPPPDSKRPRLSPAAVAKIRRWIDEGAKYETHWAYTPPTRPPVPKIPEKYAAELGPQSDRPFHRRGARASRTCSRRPTPIPARCCAACVSI